MLAAVPSTHFAYIHTQSRLLGRHKIHLSEAEYRQISRMVAETDPRAVVLQYDRRGRLGRLAVAVRLAGKWVPLVYDLADRCLVTSLPACWLSDYRDYLAQFDPDTGRRKEAN